MQAAQSLYVAINQIGTLLGHLPGYSGKQTVVAYLVARTGCATLNPCVYGQSIHKEIRNGTLLA
jgi:hypothetical protein